MLSYLRSALLLCVLVGFVGFQAIERFPEYTGPLPEWTSLNTASGNVTRVRDGDTIEVSGTPIRFGSLDCDERGSTSGDRATARMRSLISNQKLVCHLNGRSSYDRKIGSCRLEDGRDVASVMIGEGLCSRYW